MAATREMVRYFRGLDGSANKGSWKRPRDGGFGWRVLVVCSMLGKVGRVRCLFEA